MHGFQGQAVPTSAAKSDFMPPFFKKALEEKFDWWVWELGLGMTIKDRMRSGDLYLRDSKDYVSFSNLLHSDEAWKDRKGFAYEELSLPTDPDIILKKLAAEFDSVVSRAANRIHLNKFAGTDIHGGLRLKKDDRMDVSPRVRAIFAAIQENLPKVRIEDLLYEVDALTGFTKAFSPAGGFAPRTDDLDTLMAAIIAHATNLGIAQMSNSTNDITSDMLSRVTKSLLRPETIHLANAMIVDCHHMMEASSVWGSGDMASSDGQRFKVKNRLLISTFYPRYFGYYDKAVSVYTHASDQFSVFHTTVISCLVREALHVLDGYLENQTILRPRQHATDTHGYVEQLFGLCYLLGISFMPRIKDLKDQQLYRINRNIKYGSLDLIFRGGLIELSLIRGQWDEIVRLMSSLKNRTAPAHVIVERLVAGSPADRLSKALLALSRIIKTIYIVRYIDEQSMRRVVQMQLNRGEGRQSLARHIAFYKNAELRADDLDELINKASCISLVSNAVVLWNTIHMSKVVEQLRAKGEIITNEDLSHIWPLMHKKIIVQGRYFFGREQRMKYGIR